jgi:hypothetical protein
MRAHASSVLLAELQQSCNSSVCNRVATELQQSCNSAATALYSVCEPTHQEYYRQSVRAVSELVLQQSCNSSVYSVCEPTHQEYYYNYRQSVRAVSELVRRRLQYTPPQKKGFATHPHTHPHPHHTTHTQIHMQTHTHTHTHTHTLSHTHPPRNNTLLL